MSDANLGRMPDTKETVNSAIERQVQARLTQYLVARGVPQGQISLEVLFMLPPDFVHRYVQLFYLALKEDVGGHSGSVSQSQPRTVQNRPLRDSGKGGRRVLKSGKVKHSDTRKIGVYNRGGPRFRRFWTIRSEAAFDRKQSVDRKLLRLAKSIQEDLDMLEGVTTAKRRRKDSEVAQTATLCDNCSAPLSELKLVLGAMLRYCPGCGAHLVDGRPSGSSPGIDPDDGAMWGPGL